VVCSTIYWWKNSRLIEEPLQCIYVQLTSYLSLHNWINIIFICMYVYVYMLE
jgi:hypothetical protein